jgi:diguanylate cyclase (GGDEF)-like protein
MALARMKRTGDGFGLILLDLNHFKNVNDTYGHAAGDLLLKQVAERLAHSVRSYDTAARLGGDEFALLIEGRSRARDYAVIAHKIIEAISVVPFLKDHMIAEMGVSIGITMPDPNTTYTKGKLIEQADQAMYQAKLASHSNFRFYNAEINRQASERLNLESDLRTVLREDKLELHYQPIFGLSSNQFVGVEALTRWNRPPHGFIAPAHFMHIAEESNLAPVLDKWVNGSIHCLRITK